MKKPAALSETAALAMALIRCPSVTPEDAGCQTLLTQKLQAMGFDVETLPFGKVSNLWARRGNTAPLIVLAGHTDVVPPGPLDQWESDPFSPEIRDNHLYGRGAADMKGSLAAMTIGCENFLKKHPNHRGSIGFLITSDEEGDAKDGTKRVVEYLQQKGVKLDYCLIGEASSEKTFGDVIKIGRRGSLSGDLTIFGKQGHIAKPHLADNPILRSTPALAALSHLVWDQGNEQFPPTSFQISNIHAGTGATNMIPNTLHVAFNFRYSPEVTIKQLQAGVCEQLDQHHLKYSIDWQHSASPFITTEKTLINAVTHTIQTITGILPTPSTGGGTSDGRFLALTEAETVEFGPISRSIHMINERVHLDDLERLSEFYEQLLVRMLLE